VTTEVLSNPDHAVILLTGTRCGAGTHSNRSSTYEQKHLILYNLPRRSHGHICSQKSATRPARGGNAIAQEPAYDRAARRWHVPHSAASAPATRAPAVPRPRRAPPRQRRNPLPDNPGKTRRPEEPAQSADRGKLWLQPASLGNSTINICNYYSYMLVVQHLEKSNFTRQMHTLLQSKEGVLARGRSFHSLQPKFSSPNLAALGNPTVT